MSKAEILEILLEYELAMGWNLRDFISAQLTFSNHQGPAETLRQADRLLEKLAWRLSGEGM